MALQTVDQSIENELQERHGGGRHMDASRDDALRAAALKLLAEVGYDRLTVDAIAACAGAGKATIYRRWSGKAELVVDAVSCHKGHIDTPDTGSIRGDFAEICCRATEMDRQLDTQVMLGLASALPHDAELREVFQERMSNAHVQTLLDIFDHAVARGEITEIPDVDLVASILPAMILHRLLTKGELPDQAFIESVVEGVILPLIMNTDEPSL